MSLDSRFAVTELHRDRYARTGEGGNLLKKTKFPCQGMGVRSGRDLETFVRLRFTYETEHLGFCNTNLAYSDGTFVELAKTLKEEKVKFRPTAKGEQLKTFVDKTFLSVEPPSEFTYWWHKKTNEKILSSIESPQFFKDYVTVATEKRKKLAGDFEALRKWDIKFFEDSWERVVTDQGLLRDLTLQNYEGQKTSKADLLIPPTTPVISEATFEYAKKIIEYTGTIWNASTAAYLILHQSILRNDELLAKVLKFYKTIKLPILMLKIKDFEPTEPDRDDSRAAFGQIQETFCEIREKDPKKCTVLFEGGKLTYSSLVRGFDIVTNNLSGNNKLGGGNRKKGVKPNPFTRYYVNDRMVFYQYEKMQEYSENELKYTNGEHALRCSLPCCKDVKTLEGVTQSIWNYQIARPHFALSMNEEATHISNLIYRNQIQDSKKRLLGSNLCVLKNLIPDV